MCFDIIAVVLAEVNICNYICHLWYTYERIEGVFLMLVEKARDVSL